MNFTLSEEQQLLKDSADRFVEKNYGFENRRTLIESGGFSDAHWTLFADMGWLMAGLPEEHGGLGGDIVEQAILCEAFGKGMVLEPFMAVAVLAARVLAASGGPHAQQLLPQLATGDSKPVLAHGEADAFGEPCWVDMRADRNGAGWVLNGRKTLVLGGPWASHFLVSGRTKGNADDRDGVSLFLLPADCPGLTRIDVRLSDNSGASELILSDCAVGAETLIGVEGQAMAPLEEALAHAIIALCAEAVGAMEQALWTTRDYLNTRVQFGKPIGTFQALQHRMADMLIELEMARSQVFRAMAHLSAEPDTRDVAISSLKVQIGRSAKFVGGQAIQLHGGIGITDEYKIGHYFKRLTLIDNLFGSAGVHLDRMATFKRTG